jgi:site-specific DNA recombinase
MKLLDVDVYFEEQNIHTISGDGELMLTILASYAQEESRSASENQKWRIRKNYKEGKPSNHMSIYGYDYKNGEFVVIPEETEIVRMIYADYLSGMGRNAIKRKLIRLGVPTKKGGEWSESGIAGILKNEKYVGDTLLQKSFITDHLTKRQKKNRGELPQYYVESTHEAIVDRPTFEAVQSETARRAAPATRSKTTTRNEFTGIIHCLRCGANFRRKIDAGGTKYEKISWSCSTFTTRGKAFCSARRIPEDILRQKCAEALGLCEYDAEVFKARVKGINIPDNGILVFIFQDGTEHTVLWENRSRGESWTDEMKSAARERVKGSDLNV